MKAESARLEIVRAAGLAIVQDGGRPGRMHEGVPPGGALVPELLARANAAARNAHDAPAIEVFGTCEIRARGAATIACDDGVARRLEESERFVCTCGRARVRYLAARGGLDVAAVLGGRGTLLVAHLGGHEGRPLRLGDSLRIASATPADAPPPPPPPELDCPIRVVPGPDLHRFDPRALDVLLSSTFFVTARSDRVGIRLSGPHLSRAAGEDSGVSAPMVRGAIQVPPSGEPIVLGPDHPTTGGYPVLATVVRGDFGAIAGRPVGSPVRFRVVSQSGASPFHGR